MKSKILTSIFILLSFITYSQNSEIVINISGLRSDKGKCLLYLFNAKKGFPNDVKKAINSAMGNIFNGKSTIVLKDIPEGEYAIGVIHDENDNGKMDTNFIGMPKEGVGVSNNAKGHFGSPSYQDSKFQLNRKSLIMTITIKYI